MTKNSTISFLTAQSVIQQIVDSGVRYLVASPGLRNSPLLLAAHRHRELRVLTAVDERGGGFLALGLTRGSGAPAALLCTSGTAVANYLPAVLEANHSQLPLVVLTADRPTELIGTGANQCTDQTKIFGSHVRHFAEMGPPSSEATAPSQAAYVIGRALAKALRPSPGPVHVNIRFREPFLPDADALAAIPQAKPSGWKFLAAESAPPADQRVAVRAMLESSERPAILLGPGQLPRESALALAQFSETARIPILAEAASGIAFLGSEGSTLTPLRFEFLAEKMLRGEISSPDLVLRFGEPLTGRALGRLFEAHPIPQVVFEEWGEAREPHHHPSVMLEGAIAAWIRALGELRLPAKDVAWAGTLLKAEAGIHAALDRHLSDTREFTEWHFHRALESKLGSGTALFLGNSMPIRDFNSVFPASPKGFVVFANRGLSGIDGLVASAAGVALATKAETHCVIGDLSTLHDASSFALLHSLREEINLTIWVMNNAGGEIFRIVPTAKTGADPEWFTTPQDFEVASLAKAFRLPYTSIRSREDFDGIDRSAFARRGARVIEAFFAPEPNLAVRKSFLAKL